MIAKLKVALLGCGVITQRTSPGLKAILDDIGGQIVAVCDPVEAARLTVMQLCRNPDVRDFTDYASLLAESDCDIVFIATPIGMHFDQVRDALLAAKHVYCHKTLAESADKCLKLAQLANSKNLRLAASPGQILLPAYARAQEIIDAGDLGDIVSIDAGTEAAPHRYEAERASENPASDRPYSWEWYHKKAKGGGPLDDMFVYPLAFLTELLGEVTGASVRSRVVAPQIEWKGRTVIADAPDSYAGILEFGSTTATFRASFSANSQKVPWGMISIRGTRACLEIEKCNDLSYQLYITPNEGPSDKESHSVFSADLAQRRGSAECHVLIDMEELLTACVEERPVRGATAENAARVAGGLSLIKQSADRANQ